MPKRITIEQAVGPCLMGTTLRTIEETDTDHGKRYEVAVEPGDELTLESGRRLFVNVEDEIDDATEGTKNKPQVRP